LPDGSGTDGDERRDGSRGARAPGPGDAAGAA
jgi:hypothetical protein